MINPTIKHPKTIVCNGIHYRVVSYHHLSDAQAKLAVRQFLKINGEPRSSRGKEIQVQYLVDSL